MVWRQVIRSRYGEDHGPLQSRMLPAHHRSRIAIGRIWMHHRNTHAPTSRMGMASASASSHSDLMALAAAAEA